MALPHFVIEMARFVFLMKIVSTKEKVMEIDLAGKCRKSFICLGSYEEMRGEEKTLLNELCWCRHPEKHLVEFEAGFCDGITDTNKSELNILVLLTNFRNHN